MNARKRPWPRYALVALAVFLVFSAISDIVSDPSVWNWSKLAVLAVAAVFIWYGEHRTSPDRVGPEAVSAEGVEAKKPVQRDE